MRGFFTIKQGMQRVFGILFFFLASLWAFCSKVFKGAPLIVLQLDWLAACSSDGLVWPRVVVRYYSVISDFWFLVN